jgi:hypothetical protein
MENQNPVEQNNQTALIVPERNLIAIFSYLNILFWIPIFFCKDNPTIKFHLKQGFVLFVAEVIRLFAWFLSGMAGTAILLFMLVW